MFETGRGSAERAREIGGFCAGPILGRSKEKALNIRGNLGGVAKVDPINLTGTRGRARDDRILVGIRARGTFKEFCSPQ